MAQRDFYVAPLGGFNLAGAIDATLTEERGQRKLTKMKEGAEQVIRSGNPDDIAAFMVRNPQMSEYINKASKFRSDTTRSSLIDSAKKILAGENPADAIEKHIGVVDQEGGTPRESLGALGQALEDPAKSKAWAERIVAMYEPKAYASYRESQGLDGVAKPTPKQKTGAFLVKDAQGNTSVAVGSYDPSTGNLTTETAEFSGLDVVSKLGETAREQTERKVQESGLSQEATDKARRYSDLVSRGTSAAEGMATYKRGIELLKKIKTGGVSAVALAAKRFFGVSGADEGELSNSLAKAVLSQYRETFGAAFTENEGKKLDRIEASFGKSPEANSRLLAQGLKMSERTANRAIKAAERREDYETADDIRDLLEFTLSTEAPTQPAPAQPIAPQQQQYREGQTATGPGGQKLIFSNGNWGPM